MSRADLASVLHRPPGGVLLNGANLSSTPTPTGHAPKGWGIT
jgi:hypothetical protein